MGTRTAQATTTAQSVSGGVATHTGLDLEIAKGRCRSSSEGRLYAKKPITPSVTSDVEPCRLNVAAKPIAISNARSRVAVMSWPPLPALPAPLPGQAQAFAIVSDKTAACIA